MTSPDSPEFGSFFLVPFRVRPEGHPLNSTILDHLCAHPYWTQAPMAPEDLRRNYAALLVDPRHGVYEVWRGDQLLGILTLHGIIPGIEATLHFVFFDDNLVGKRLLLRQFIAKCFRDWGFRRLVMEVPEPMDKLIRIMRKYGFLPEGETALTGHPLMTRLRELGIDHPERWVARQGSRKEGAHWYDGRWCDLMRLRLLREEWEASSM